jgi:membrane associated rhomboid family serine protease
MNMTTERKRLLLDLLFPSLFVGLLWLIELIQLHFQINLQAFGIYPRSIKGLPGIILSPLIHGSLEHLESNSLPLMVLGTMMFYFYRGIAFRIFLWVYFTTGLWVWAGARGGDAYHIGASGLIYGFVSFLFFAGIFRKDPRLMQISLLVLLFYNGLIWGVFPLIDHISWESHLLGSVAGIVCAWFFRSEGPERVKYSWELEPEEEEDQDDNLPGPPDPIDITYVFVPTEKTRD